MQTFLVSAEEAKRLAGEMVPIEAAPGHAHRMAFTIRVPRGVVCGITSFNSPLNMVAHKVAPALAVGQHRGASNRRTPTPLCGDAALRAAARSRVPARHTSTWCTGPGANSAVAGREPGHRASSRSPAARASASGCATRVGLRPVALELGSIAATIVCEDARPRSRGRALRGVRLPPRRADVHVDAAAVRARGRASSAFTARLVQAVARAEGRRSARSGDRRRPDDQRARGRAGRSVGPARRSRRARGCVARRHARRARCCIRRSSPTCDATMRVCARRSSRRCCRSSRSTTLDEAIDAGQRHAVRPGRRPLHARLDARADGGAAHPRRRRAHQRAVEQPRRPDAVRRREAQRRSAAKARSTRCRK